MSDALSSNNAKEEDLIRCHCLAHGRRKFSELDEVFPLESAVVVDALKVGYEHEEEARDKRLNAQERLGYHQTYSAPIMDALKTWLKLKPSGELVAQMLTTLAWQKQQDAWVKDGGQYVPHPASWLNAGRWDDEPQAAPHARLYEPWVCPHEPHCKHRPACDFISMRQRA